MTDPLKKEEPKQTPPAKRVFAEATGVYRLIDGQKVFSFSFPAQSSLEDNLAAVSYLKDEIMKAINDKIAQEKAKEAKTEEPNEEKSDK